MSDSVLSIGFVGFGRMASALWSGFMRTGLVGSKSTYFYVPSLDSQKRVSLAHGIVAVSLETLVQKSDLIFFCVKPQQIHEVLAHFPTLDPENLPIMVSILAGVPLTIFHSYLGDQVPLVRVMPNTPSVLGEGVSAIYYNNQVSPPYRKQVAQLFHGCGQVVDVPEIHFDLVTGMSGSGPAFLYRMVKDILDYGATMGLDAHVGLKIMAQTLVGAGKMLQESGKSPSELIAEVCSPQGTTLAGLTRYDQVQLGHHLQSVVEAAVLRAAELSRDIGGRG